VEWSAPKLWWPGLFFDSFRRSRKTSRWRLKRLVTLLNYGCYINKFIYLSVYLSKNTECTDLRLEQKWVHCCIRCLWCIKGNPVNVRPNVFSDVLKPSPDRRDLTALQLELHSRTSRTVNQYKVILNSMRLIGVFDWLLATKDLLAVSFEDPFKKGTFLDNATYLIVQCYWLYWKDWWLYCKDWW